MFLSSIILTPIYRETLPMPKTIISDTSCLIILANIDEPDVLQKLYKQIVTTADIAAEFGEY